MRRSTASKFFYRVCKAIIHILNSLEIPAPNTEMWLHNAREFWEKWNFPNCVCAADEKHVTMFCPARSGSLYYNYKHRFSIVLMAGRFELPLCSGRHQSLQKEPRRWNMEAVANGATVFLSGSNLIANHAFVADEAFPLKDYHPPLSRS